jgi:WD40 repeat protein
MHTYSQEDQKVWQWMEQLGGAGWDMPNGIATDDDDNIYIAGAFTTSLENGSTSIESEGNRDIYVARFSSEGELEWLWQAGGEHMDKITAVKSAPDNDLYVAGLLEGEMEFGNIDIEEDGKKLFVSRINKKGKSDWVQTLPYTGTASGYLLETDFQGNIILSGVFSDSLSCDGTSLISAGHKDMFLLSLNEDGEMQQLLSYGTSGKEKVTALSTDTLGNIYLAGKYTKDFTLGAYDVKIVNNSKEGNCFMAKLNASYTTQWVKTMSSESYAEVRGMVCDSSNVLLTGNFKHKLTIDTLSYESNGLIDFFVACIDSLGNTAWLNSYGGKYNDRSSQVKLNLLGGAMVLGNFQDSITMDTVHLSAYGNSADAFVAQFDTTGSVLWAQSFQGDRSNRAEAATLDSDGNLYLTGTFKGTIEVGDQQIESLGDEDIYVAKYYNCPEVDNAIEHPDCICEGSTAILSVGNGYSDIVWNDSITDVNELEVELAGDYYISMIDDAGCVVKDTISLIEAVAQEFSIGQDTSLLIGEQIELSGPDDVYAYKWQDGNDLQSIDAYCETGEEGYYNYVLTITDTLGCEWTDSLQIEFYDEPTYADLSEGESLISIYPNPVEDSFTWYLELESDTDAKMTVEIRNTTGILMYSKAYDRYISEETISVDISAYETGIYYFFIISDGNSISTKLLKI